MHRSPVSAPLFLSSTQPPTSEGGDDWVAVEGLDRQTVELKRQYEAEVEQKVTQDHQHVVWAYGLIWAIFAVYGWLLWRRGERLERDLATLRAKLDQSK